MLSGWYLGVMEKEPETTSNPEVQPAEQWAPWRWPIVVLALAFMVLIAYIVSIKTAKDVTVGTAREAKETVAEITEAAISISENFQQAKITETFVENLSKLEDAGEGNLEVAVMENTKTFKRQDKRTIFWDKISLGTTITEIKVPATYRYHIRLKDKWQLEVRNQQCVVIAPYIQATTPVAIHTDKMEKRVDEGWARFNANEQMDALHKSITPKLSLYAASPDHVDMVREHARKTVAEFVRQWLMDEDHWREDRFSTIQVIFADEAAKQKLPLQPTLELN